MAKGKNIDLKRVNINLPSHIVDRVKEYADNLGINVTSAYIVLLNQALEQKDMLSNLPTLISMGTELKNLALEQKDNLKLIDNSSKI